MKQTTDKSALFEWLQTISEANQQIDTTLAQATVSTALNIDHAVDESNLLQAGIQIAEILLSLECDSTTFCAGLIYPFFHATKIQQKAHREEFDKTIFRLLNGVTKMDGIQAVRTNKTQSDNQQDQINKLRKMLLAIVDDIRTVLIKLAEQLSVLQSLKEAPADQQQQIAQNVMDFYAPLANRLGVGQLKWQLEDWAFRYLDNTKYKSISKALSLRRTERVDAIATMQSDLNMLLITEGDFKQADITGRAKHIYSIHKKLTRKQLPFSELYDTNAMRILVTTIEDCYSVLSLVHAKWPHIQKEFDDYIANPKPNGYQSIHTAVTRDDGAIFEIQIRTFDMHEKAELGVAAHWKYKENSSSHGSYEEKISLLREVINWQQEVSSSQQEATIYQQAFQDRIYVFSPNGDIYELPNGSTPLDFAYLLHTDVGHRCKGAKINGKLAPLTTSLKTGDQIDIVTAKEAKPSRDWIRPELGFLATTNGIKKVKHWFRKLDHEQKLHTGSSLWEKTARQQNLAKKDLTETAKHFNFKNTEGLLVALGSGDIHISNIIRHLREDEKIDSAEPLPIQATKPITTENTNQSQIDTGILGTNSLLTQLAKCCSPIPGDSIVGYITKNKGISIHRDNCKNLEKKLQRSPLRIIPIHWKDEETKSYRLNVTLVAETHPELEKDLSSLTQQLQTPVLAIETYTKKNKPHTTIQLTLALKEKDKIKDILQRLRKLSHIIELTRQ